MRPERTGEEGASPRRQWDNATIATWNTRALLSTDPLLFDKKWKVVQSLVADLAIACLQETHGDSFAGEALAARVKATHISFVSPGATNSTGGLITMIRHEIGNVAEARVTEVHPGRILAIIVPATEGHTNLCVINIHNHEVPQASIVKLRRFKTSVQRGHPLTEIVMVGDFNFGADDDPTLHSTPDGRTVRYRDRREAQRWKYVLDDTTELVHHLPTRAAYRQTLRGRALVHSRIDRVFTTISPATLAVTKVSLRITDIRQALPSASHSPASDHVPVRATMVLRPSPPPSRRPIPRWVTAHPMYKAKVQQKLRGMDLRGLDRETRCAERSKCCGRLPRR